MLRCSRCSERSTAMTPLLLAIMWMLTLTRIRFKNIAADHVHPFIMAAFPGGRGLLQHDNAPLPKVQSVDLASKFPRGASDLASVVRSM